MKRWAFRVLAVCAVGFFYGFLASMVSWLVGIERIEAMVLFVLLYLIDGSISKEMERQG